MRENPPKRCRGRQKTGGSRVVGAESAVERISILINTVLYSRCRLMPAMNRVDGNQDNSIKESRGKRRALGGVVPKGPWRECVSFDASHQKVS